MATLGASRKDKLMDDPIAILRMMERIIAVLIGGFGIYLGYRLFYHLPFERSHKGELALPGVKIVLSRVGPGVFFAAFGSLVLYYSLTEPVTVTMPSVADSGAPQIGQFTGMAPASATSRASQAGPVQATPQQRARALSTIEMLNCTQRILVHAGSKSELQGKMLPALRDAKRALLLTVWNTDDWGPTDQLGVTGPVENAPFQLRNLFDATYKGCPA